MTPSWILMVLLASGEISVATQVNELACDRERAAIVNAAIAAENGGLCPMAVAASCVYGLVTHEFITEGK